MMAETQRITLEWEKLSKTIDVHTAKSALKMYRSRGRNNPFKTTNTLNMSDDDV